MGRVVPKDGPRVAYREDLDTSGYRLPFLRYPVPVFKANHHSAFMYSEYVEEAIAQLLKAGCVLECASSSLVCSPLQVVISGGERSDWWLTFVTLTSS